MNSIIVIFVSFNIFNITSCHLGTSVRSSLKSVILNNFNRTKLLFLTTNIFYIQNRSSARLLLIIVDRVRWTLHILSARIDWYSWKHYVLRTTTVDPVKPITFLERFYESPLTDPESRGNKAENELTTEFYKSMVGYVVDRWGRNQHR